MFIFNGINAQSCEYRLAGHVEDEHTKDKLEGATITLVGTERQVMTDEHGNFIFNGLCAGTYTLEISHIDCSTVTRKISLTRNQHIDILLPHAQNTLETVTISATRTSPQSGFKAELSGNKLEATRGTSIAEAANKITGVSMLRTGSNVAKPVIHGLHGNRILLINNGIRQEGQQWGNEHAPEIDPFIADKLTVIKGVDELRYGSDAIGGVIIVDARPLKHFPGISSALYTGYSTNGRKYYGSAFFEQQFKKIPIGYRIQGTFKQGANIHTPGYTLNNTGMKEYNFSVTAGLKKEHYSIEGYLSHFNTSAAVYTGSHIGNLYDLQVAIDAAEPDPIYLGEETYRIVRPRQQVAHSLFKVKSSYTKGKNKLFLTIGGQMNERQEYDKSRSNTNTSPQLDLLIYTLTEELAWEHAAWGKLKGTIGVSLMQQDNSFAGRYFIPNYTSNTNGLYWIEKLAYDKWELHGGIRFDHKQINTRRMMYNGTQSNHSFNFNTIGSSVNLLLKPTEHFRINTGVTASGRAPHVNELLSSGIHHGTATFEEGNIHLTTERSLNSSVGIEWETNERNFSFGLTGYSNWIDDYIYRKPVPGEPVLTIAGAFPKIIFSQTDATIMGLDADMKWKIIKPLHWNLQASIIRGKETNTDQWLIYMPSDRLTNELVFNFNDSKIFSLPYVSAEMVHVSRQTRVPGDEYGKQDYKAPPGAYTLFNFTAASGISVGKLNVDLGLTVENLFNVRYRDYLNSFRYFTDEMGRNISFRIRIPASR